MRLLIAAGGTGGHIYPGIAVAREVMRRDEASEVLFVGTTRGLESRIVPENGFQLSLINSAGLKNVGLLGQLKGLAVLPRSFYEARRLIKEFKPDVVVGAGGYVSGPVLLVASMLRVPTMIMDSNALPGFTNRRLARFVDKAAVAFEAAAPFFGEKAVITGNPVRKDFFEIGPREADGKTDILIFGGSQGARAINNAMTGALPFLEVHKDRLTITHQTGEGDFDNINQLYIRAGWDNADIRPYISDMVAEFAKADIVICRAGATTCAELAAAGRASVMIPLPTAADDHQRKNAEAMQAAGASMMIVQSELSSESLARAIKQLAWEENKLNEMAQAARSLGRDDAAERTVDLIEELGKGKNV